MIARKAESLGDGREWPLQIYTNMVHSLYAESRSLVLGAIAVAIGVFVTAWRTGLPSLFALSALALLLGIMRVAHSRLYLKRGTVPRSRAEALLLERRYTYGAGLAAFLMGIWCLLVLVGTADEVSVLFAVAITIANVVGIAGRNFAMKNLVIAQISFISGPLLLGLLMQGDIYHVILGAMLAPFMLSITALADKQRLTLLNAVLRERDVRVLAEQFDTALNNMPHGLCLFDADSSLVVSNSRLEALFELGNVEEGTIKARAMVMDLVAARRISALDGEKLLQAFEGDPRWCERKLKVLFDDRITLEFAFRAMDKGGTIVVFEDITDRLRAEQKIERMARYDSLTGLPNRESFHGQIKDVLRARPSAGSVGVMMLDVDGFKQINDTLGHSVGDQLLCKIVEELEDITSSAYFVSRFGGDEFLILMPELRCQEEAAVLAGMIVERMTQSFMAGEHQVFVGMSIGIALNKGQGDKADALIRNADLALYRAKAEGRGTWRFYTESMGEQQQARLELEHELRKAVEHETIDVHFQPLINLAERKITTCEALVRWNHPVMGPISPGRFIPVAEDMGLILELGDVVLNKACMEAANWDSGVSVAVNLSSIQFRRGDIVNSIENALADSGLPAGRLEVEITESVLLEDIQSVRQTLHRLCDMGVRISLDDFGTGYSSLSYLHSLPLHKVKIDRSFVVELEHNARSLVLLQNIARLSSDLGLKLVVEGVETEAQLDIVRSEMENCEVQGFIFSGALPPKEIHTLINVSRPAKPKIVKMPRKAGVAKA